ncbi:MAG: thiolase family protein [Bacteroidia bacterium]|jgi:acetyl-CoA acetyltransferase family protein|nr:thiolase family protein [Bacteroidia bacterium]
MAEAYIITGYRTAVAKANKGGFKSTRPDDLAVNVISYLMSQVPQLDPLQVDDVIVGNAVPEAEQGMQMGRLISLLSLPQSVPGMVINRYCGSGLEAIAIAVAKIKSGMADCIIAGGTESMSLVPTIGWRTVLNYTIASQHPTWYSSMGATAEAVADQFNISREDQDTFALHSHQKAIQAINAGKFNSQIVPVEVTEVSVNEIGKRISKSFVVKQDEGPRMDTSLESLAKLKPVFKQQGTVTAGNASQTSDGASFVLVMSEHMMKSLGLNPVARLITYAVSGVDPRIMGIGPVEAIPAALKKAGMKLNQIQQIELNEAFASQSLAVMRQLDLNPEIVNVNGGAIALGHPLGCSGAKLSVQLWNEMKSRNQQYGMVSACVGGGQGVAGIYEVF